MAGLTWAEHIFEMEYKFKTLCKIFKGVISSHFIAVYIRFKFSGPPHIYDIVINILSVFYLTWLSNYILQKIIIVITYACHNPRNTPLDYVNIMPVPWDLFY